MKITDKVKVEKFQDLIIVDFTNGKSLGTIFKIKDQDAENLVNNVGVRLTRVTAKKLGEALIKLSKEK